MTPQVNYIAQRKEKREQRKRERMTKQLKSGELKVYHIEDLDDAARAKYGFPPRERSTV